MAVGSGSALTLSSVTSCSEDLTTRTHCWYKEGTTVEYSLHAFFTASTLAWLLLLAGMRPLLGGGGVEVNFGIRLALMPHFVKVSIKSRISHVHISLIDCCNCPTLVVMRIVGLYCGAGGASSVILRQSQPLDNLRCSHKTELNNCTSAL